MASILVLVCSQSRTTWLVSSRCAPRVTGVAKRGSSLSSGRPTTSSRRYHCSLLLTCMKR